MRADGAASTPGLHLKQGYQVGYVILAITRSSTCPPEKPTATTPSSVPLERNFGVMVDGEVILATRFIYLSRTLELN